MGSAWGESSLHTPSASNRRWLVEVTAVVRPSKPASVILSRRARSIRAVRSPPCPAASASTLPLSPAPITAKSKGLLSMGGENGRACLVAPVPGIWAYRIAAKSWKSRGLALARPLRVQANVAVSRTAKGGGVGNENGDGDLQALQA